MAVFRTNKIPPTTLTPWAITTRRWVSKNLLNVWFYPDCLRSSDPWVKALETTAFAIPEVGVVVSAGIGLLWKAVEPGAIKTYQAGRMSPYDK